MKHTIDRITIAALLAVVPGTVFAAQEPQIEFIRGDVDSDGIVLLTDGLYLLNWLFQNGEEPSCLEAADVDGNGTPDLSDAVALFNFLFLEGDEPPAPSPLDGKGFAEEMLLGCDGGDPYIVDKDPLRGGDLSAGDGFTCAILPEHENPIRGEVACWGRNDAGQLGVGDVVGRAAPTRVDHDEFIVTKVSAGRDFACALEYGNGEVWCWGSGEFGQLGEGVSGPVRRPVEPLVDFGGNLPAVDIAAGGRHACAIRHRAAGDQVLCWGDNTSGQLGFDSDDEAPLPGVVDLGGRQPVSVVAGGQHTCVLTDQSVVLCWGGNSYRQLDRDGADRSRPVEISFSFGLQPAWLVAGVAHTCAVGQFGSRDCWGGSSSRGGNTELVVALGGGGGSEYVFDEFHAFDAACFADGFGVSGCDLGANVNVLDPRTLPPRPRTLAVGDYHGCAAYDEAVVCPDGIASTICCFGDNDMGQLGNSNRPQSSATPVAVQLPE